MNKSILLWLAFLVTLNLNAQDSKAILLDVNSEWENIDWIPKKTNQVFENHEQKISYHLDNVIAYLKIQPTALLSHHQSENREELIQVLAGYRSREVYPQNEFLSYRNPVFIDNYGTHCAVGFLMKESGHGQLANTISANENLAYVSEIKTVGVAEWAKENGFSLSELALIQPSYFEPIGSVSEIQLYEDGEVIQTASSKTELFILKYSDSTKTKKSILRFYSNYGNLQYGGDLEYPDNYDDPSCIEVLNDKLFVGTPTGVNYATIEGTVNDTTTWNNFSTAFGDVYKMKRLHDRLALFRKSDNIVVTDFKDKTDYVSGTSAIMDVDEYLLGNFMYYTTLEYDGSLSILRSSSFVYDTMYYRFDGIFNYNQNLFCYGNFFSNSPNLGNAGLVNSWGSSIIVNSELFDLTIADPSWYVGGMVEAFNRLFVLGKFSGGSTIGSLPSTGIIELNALGTNKYYSLPVGEFEEVYEAHQVGLYLVLNTSNGLYRIKFALASHEHFDKSKVSLYPNPIANGQTLSVSGLGGWDTEYVPVSHIKLTSLSGQELIESQSRDLPISGLSAGVYFCEITMENKDIVRKKIVVQ